MEFDLTFTKSEKWLSERQKIWTTIEGNISEGLTKKQLESVRQYFLSGIPGGWIKKIPSALLCFFPSCSEAGVRYVLKEYVSLKGSFSEAIQYETLNTVASMNLAEWPGATLEEQISIFKMFFGDSYNPEAKFPFLIGNETEHRDYHYDAGGLYSVILYRLVGWCRTEEVGIQVWPHLLGYWLSTIPYVEPWVFKRALSEQEEKARIGGGSVGLSSRKLQELMRNIVNLDDFTSETPYGALRREKLQQLGDYLDGLREPQELVEHWQWAKKEFANE